jgi:hypothetical protein
LASTFSSISATSLRGKGPVEFTTFSWTQPYRRAHLGPIRAPHCHCKDLTVATVCTSAA